VAAQTVETRPDTRYTLRNEPVQARSTARLTTLLDAAATIVDEIGFERLTTAMVADRAGASIGTVYRYFPDRIALLQALGARNLERTLGKVEDEIGDPRHENWLDALSAGFGILVEAFRSEPGFRGLRVGDVIDLRPAPTEPTGNSVVAQTLVDRLIDRFGVDDTPELRFKFEAAMEVSDALATRAFARDPKGDDRFLDEGRDVVYRMLVEHLGDVRR
jgi:AcrR family transcriptional regulator